MSALPDRPDDFAQFCLREGLCEATNATQFFAPRAAYGRYLAEALANHAPHTARVRQVAVDIVATPLGERIHFANGDSLVAARIVLATGHAWGCPGTPLPAPDPDAALTLAGTGLTMLDRFLCLRAGGHTGPLTALSRHGLVPLDHGTYPSPAVLSEVPVGASIRMLTRWLRQQARLLPDWRMAVDGLRPHTQAIWQAWPESERRRFLRHVRRYWDVHRHRAPADIVAMLRAEIDAGSFSVRRGRCTGPVPAALDCRGHLPDWQAIGNPLLRRLLARGRIAPDALGLGLAVTGECQLVDATGEAQSPLYAAGPLTRGRFWEIEAVPDIRQQVRLLAAELCPR